MHGKPGQPCLECHRKANAEWRAANPVLDKAIKQAYADSHQEYNRECGLKRYYANHEALKAQNLAYARAHSEERKAYNRKYHTANAESERLYRRQRRLKNLAHERARAAAWAKSNPTRKRELDSIADSRRRARILGAKVNDFTRQQWRDMLEQYGHRCAYCGRKFDQLQKDHIIPLSKGGDHTAQNIAPACGTCNKVKKDRTLADAGMKFRVLVRL